MKNHNRLVRDKVIDKIKASGKKYQSRKLTTKEYKQELLKTLVEEALEVSNATDKMEMMVELADVEEVIKAIMDAYKLNRSQMTKYRNRKKKERGGFDKRIFLEKVEK